MNRWMFLTGMLIILTIHGCKSTEKEPFAGSGIIEAKEVTISSQSQGELLILAFEEGDHVQKNQTIAEVDAENLKLSRDVASADLADVSWNEKILEKEIAVSKETVSQASITLSNVQKNRDRIYNLFQQNAATQESLDKAETELALSISRLQNAEKQLALNKTRLSALGAKREKIEANLRLLDKQIADSKITSPVDGIVIEKFKEQGEVVNYGSPVCTIADLVTVWLNVYVSEDMIGKLSVGGKADVRIDSHPEKRFEGRITWISPRAEFTPKNVQTKDSRVDLVYAVKITLENPDGIFKIGMPADVYIEGL